MFDYVRHPRWDKHGVELTFEDLPHRINLTEFENHAGDDFFLRMQEMIEWCIANLGEPSVTVADGLRWCHMMNGMHFRTKADAMLFKLSCGESANAS